MKSAAVVLCVCVSVSGASTSVAAQGSQPQDPFHFRYDQVPIACEDLSECPSGAICFGGKCRFYCTNDAQCPQIWMEDVGAPTVYCSSSHFCEPYLEVQNNRGDWLWTANVAPPTRSYVAPNRDQPGGGCYIHGPAQTFQTKYAVELDLRGYYDWGPDDLDRSIFMSPLPFYQCAGVFGDVYRFLDHGGLVDMCHEPYWKARLVADTCGYYGRYMSPPFVAPWPAESAPGVAPYRPPCSAPQMARPRPLVYRSNGWSPEAPGTYSISDISSLIRQHGPLAMSGHEPGGEGHVISVVGYDTRPTFYQLAGIPLNSSYSPQICYQSSSWGDDRGPHGHGLGAVCRPYDEGGFKWHPLTAEQHLLDVRPPGEFDPVTRAPFIEWIMYAAHDMDGDGIPDDVDPDIDGDRARNEFDPAPYNPYQMVDTDGDGLPEPRLVDPETNKFSLESCLAWCRSQDQLGWSTSGWQGGGQGCQDRCRGFDRCITTGIKNVFDNQCNWFCVSMERDCQPSAGAEYSDCCNPAELGLLVSECRPLYHNVSNVDSDAQNPDVDDSWSQIADVCEEAGAVLPEMSLDEVVLVGPYIDPDEGLIIRVGDRCSDWRVKIETGFYGGSTWVKVDNYRTEISSVHPMDRIGEIGVCGCDAGNLGWADCDQCPQTRDWYFADIQAWRDVSSPQCALLPDLSTPSPNSTLCDNKLLALHRDEDCSDGVCNIAELFWSWSDDPNVFPGETIKTRVGLRRLGEDWRLNVLYPSVDPVVLPDPALQCSSILPWDDLRPFLRLDGWQQRPVPEPPQLRLGGRLGSLAVARDTDTKELYVFELDKQLRGPLNPRRFTYPEAVNDRIDGDAPVVTFGRVSARVLGGPEEGSLALFALSRRDQPCPTPSCGGMSVSTLWVAGLGEGQRELRRAEDLFGPSEATPPAMASPAAVWDSATSRLFVAGGGESHQFGLWAYLPEVGQWKAIPTGQPADLQGVAMAADPVMHRVYLLGGSSGADRLPALVVVDTTTESATELASLPPELDRAGAAAAIDPYNRLLYLYGGRRGRQVMGDLWQLDLRTKQWLQLDDGGDSSSPGPREGAEMLYERRYGRLWVSGGRDDGGPLLPTVFAFATAMNTWHEQPLGPETSPGGGSTSGLLTAASPVMWKVAIPETTPLPGRLIKLTLTADDPCVGLQVWDSAGERLARTLHCTAGDRSASLLGQPGESYWVVLEPLPGFAADLGSTYEVRLDDATLTPAGSLPLAAPGAWPRTVLAEASPGGPVGYVLLGESLVSLSLDSASSAGFLDELALPRGEATGLVVDRRRAFVSMDSPGGADLVQVVGVTEPANLQIAGEIALPGQAGRLLALSAGGQVFAAKSGKVEIVDLMDPAGPTPKGSLNVGGKITCLHSHGSWLYVCTQAGRLKVYALQRKEPPLLRSDVALSAVGQSVRVHGRTVHVAELGKQALLACEAGGPCNSSGAVEVLRHGANQSLARVGEYPMGLLALPHLAMAGDVAARAASGGVELFQVEVVP